jgi:hypothetical protein
VIVLTPREPLPSLVIQARDTVPQAAPVVVMAALQPPVTAPRQRIALKLLVDCSGSMGGDGIASARVALHGALAGLTEHDQVSVSRFGSTVEHVLAPSACTPQTLRRLKPSVDAIDANLGGTEMEAALKAVFALPVSRDCAGADVLLVTDGEIWQAEEMTRRRPCQRAPRFRDRRGLVARRRCAESLGRSHRWRVRVRHARRGARSRRRPHACPHPSAALARCPHRLGVRAPLANRAAEQRVRR